MNPSPLRPRLILAACFALHAVLLFASPGLLPVWGDEFFTLTAARQPLPDLLQSYAGDVNPPLHGLLVHFWLRLPWPWQPAVSARLLSALVLLLAAFAILRLWTNAESPAARLWFVALWCFSPTLLMFGRMARSYSLQILLFTLALHAALRLVEDPRRLPRLLRFALWEALLLYTHYLPALALLAAVLSWTAWLAVRRKNFAPLGAFLAAAGLAAALYAPWLAYLGQTLGRVGRAAAPDVPGNPLVAQLLPLGYSFFSFTFGETPPDWVFFAAILAGPAALWLLIKGAQAKPPWLPAVAVAGLVAFLGASRWVGFVFVPARLLYLLPFFLLLLARGIRRAGRLGFVAGAALLVLSLGSVWSYFHSSGFLNKAYIIPYEQIGGLIRSQSAGRGAVVVADACNLDPWPVAAAVKDDARVLLVGHEGSFEELLNAVMQDTPGLIWHLHNTRDACPGQFNRRLAESLSQGRAHRAFQFVEFTPRDRWLLRLLGADGARTHLLQLDEYRAP